jgi:hypothetical protein
MPVILAIARSSKRMAVSWLTQSKKKKKQDPISRIIKAKRDGVVT